MSAGCRQQHLSPSIQNSSLVPSQAFFFCKEQSSLLLFSSLCLLLSFVRNPWWNCRGGFIALDWGLLGRCASLSTALGGGKVCTVRTVRTVHTHTHVLKSEICGLSVDEAITSTCGLTLSLAVALRLKWTKSPILPQERGTCIHSTCR